MPEALVLRSAYEPAQLKDDSENREENSNDEIENKEQFGDDKAAEGCVLTWRRTSHVKVVHEAALARVHTVSHHSVRKAVEARVLRGQQQDISHL